MTTSSATAAAPARRARKANGVLPDEVVQGFLLSEDDTARMARSIYDARVAAYEAAYQDQRMRLGLPFDSAWSPSADALRTLSDEAHRAADAITGTYDLDLQRATQRILNAADKAGTTLSADQLANELRTYCDGRRAWKAEQIARYETGQAAENATLDVMSDLEAGEFDAELADIEGFVMENVYVVVLPDGSEVEDVCAAYAGYAFSLDEAWGIPEFPAHCNCPHEKVIMSAGDVDPVDLDPDEVADWTPADWANYLGVTLPGDAGAGAGAGGAEAGAGEAGAEAGAGAETEAGAAEGEGGEATTLSEEDLAKLDAPEEDYGYRPQSLQPAPSSGEVTQPYTPHPSVGFTAPDGSPFFFDTGVPSPHSYQIDYKALARAQRPREVLEWLRTTFPNVSFQFDEATTDLNSIKAVARGLGDMAKQYPEAFGQLRLVSTTDNAIMRDLLLRFPGSTDETLDRTLGAHFRLEWIKMADGSSLGNGSVIAFGPNFMDAPTYQQLFAYGLKTGHFAEMAGTQEGVVYHEFGHLIQSWLAGAPSDVARGEYVDLLAHTADYWAGANGYGLSLMSGYGMTNEDEQFAEGFLALLRGTPEQQATDYVERLKAILKLARREWEWPEP